MKRLLSNSFGMSLVEIMMAAGLTAALSVYISQTLLKLNKAQKNNAVEASIMNHAHTSQGALFREAFCRQAFNGLELRGVVVGEASATYADDLLNPGTGSSGFVQLRDYGYRPGTASSNAKFKAGQVFDGGDARFITARIVNHQPLSGAGTDQLTAAVQVQHIYEKYPKQGTDTSKRLLKSGEVERYLYFYTWLKIGEQVDNTTTSGYSVAGCRAEYNTVVNEAVSKISRSFISVEEYNSHILGGSPLEAPLPGTSSQVDTTVTPQVTKIHLNNGVFPANSHLKYLSLKIQEQICNEIGSAWDSTSQACAPIHSTSGDGRDNERCQDSPNGADHYFARGFDEDGNIVPNNADYCGTGLRQTTCADGSTSPGNCKGDSIEVPVICPGTMVDGVCTIDSSTDKYKFCPDPTKNETSKNSSITLNYVDNPSTPEYEVIWETAPYSYYPSGLDSTTGGITVAWAKSKQTYNEDTITWTFEVNDKLQREILFKVRHKTRPSIFNSGKISINIDCTEIEGAQDNICPATHPIVVGLNTGVSPMTLICGTKDGSSQVDCKDPVAKCTAP